MDNITIETRNDSYDEILPSVGARQQLCLELLQELGGAATSNEIALLMYQKGLVPYPNTNFCSPRLNELTHLKMVEVVGKKYITSTQRSCAIYKIIEKEDVVK